MEAHQKAGSGMQDKNTREGITQGRAADRKIFENERRRRVNWAWEEGTLCMVSREAKGGPREGKGRGLMREWEIQGKRTVKFEPLPGVGGGVGGKSFRIGVGGSKFSTKKNFRRRGKMFLWL